MMQGKRKNQIADSERMLNAMYMLIAIVAIVYIAKRLMLVWS
jgi:hypothetical protein